MVMATIPTDRDAMLLAAWEQMSKPPPMERGLLLKLVGLYGKAGPKASLVLEGQIRVAVAQTCTSVMEQWSAINDTGLTLASPRRLLSQGSCIAHLVDSVAFALSVVIVIRLFKLLKPSRSRGPRRIG